MKRCSKCGEEKPLDSFSKNKGNKDGLAYACRSCMSVCAKNYRRSEKGQATRKKYEHTGTYKASRKTYIDGHHEKCLAATNKWSASGRGIKMAMDNRLRNTYNITLEQYDEIYEAQHGVCAICGLPQLTQRLSVDHNHVTGKIRGLLCTRCNVGLGTYENRKEEFESYLGDIDRGLKK